jgi:hypothetical protein
MKPLAYFRFALLIPYILWCICAAILFVLSAQKIPDALNILYTPAAFYVIGIILWFVPYTLLAAGLMIWSRNKSTVTLSKSAAIAPIMFFALLSIEALLITLPADIGGESIKEALNLIAFLGVISIPVGYLCVGMAAMLYLILRSRGLVKGETIEQLG